MKSTPYYFEIKDIITQFVTAFDDIVIRRYNINRVAQDRIGVRYVYAPKQRVLADITNQAQNITIPAVAVNISRISRDNTRVFNKLEGGTYTDRTTGANLKMPVPIDITVDVSIITKFQTDMDQILSNFVPYSNPYIVISWPMPEVFGLPNTQEIRSPVIWSGDISMEYPINLTGADKERIIADTSFTIKGWLFKEQTSASAIIYYITENFTAVDLNTTLTYGISGETETFELSGIPAVTNMFWRGVLMDGNVHLAANETGSVILYGNRFDTITGVMLSSTNTTFFTALTSFNTLGRDPQTIIGQAVPITVVNENIITFDWPAMSPNFREPHGRMTILLYSEAGYVNTSSTYLRSYFDPVTDYTGAIILSAGETVYVSYSAIPTFFIYD